MFIVFNSFYSIFLFTLIIIIISSSSSSSSSSICWDSRSKYYLSNSSCNCF